MLEVTFTSPTIYPAPLSSHAGHLSENNTDKDGLGERGKEGSHIVCFLTSLNDSYHPRTESMKSIRNLNDMCLKIGAASLSQPPGCFLLDAKSLNP
jgi:hypothetical protein